MIHAYVHMSQAKEAVATFTFRGLLMKTQVINVAISHTATMALGR